MMTWNDVLILVVESLVGLVLSVGLPYLLVLLAKKIKNEKLLKFIGNIVEQSVLTVKQTFVQSLKEEGKFDKDAQSEAFSRCMKSIVSMLSEEAKKFIVNNFGDLETYLTTLIESKVSATRESVTKS